MKVLYVLIQFCIDIIGLSLSWANLFGYYKCNGDHKRRVKEMEGNITKAVVSQFVGKMMS